MHDILFITSDFPHNSCLSSLGSFGEVKGLVIMLQNKRRQVGMSDPHKSLLCFGTEDDGWMKVVHAYMCPVKKQFSAVSRTIGELHTCAGDTARTQILEAHLIQCILFLDDVKESISRF